MSMRPLMSEPSWLTSVSYISSNVKEPIINLRVDVHEYRPDELTVRLKGNVLTVEAMQNVYDPKEGFISSSLHRRFFLSYLCDPRHLTAVLADGILKLNSSRPARGLQNPVEHVIPIQNLGNSGGDIRDSGFEATRGGCANRGHKPLAHSSMIEGRPSIHQNCPSCSSTALNSAVILE